MHIVPEPLRPDHLEHFDPAYPMPPVPDYQIGQGVAFVCDGEVAAIACLFDDGEAVELGLVRSATVNAPALAAHRLARAMVHGLAVQGYRRLRAHATEPETAKWLRLLGFNETEDGVFVRWQ